MVDKILVQLDLRHQRVGEIPGVKRNSRALAPINGIVPGRVGAAYRRGEFKNGGVARKLPRGMGGLAIIRRAALPVIVRHAIHLPDNICCSAVAGREPMLGVRQDPNVRRGDHRECSRCEA